MQTHNKDEFGLRHYNYYHKKLCQNQVSYRHFYHKTQFGLEHCMQLQRLATNPSLDWNTACSSTRLQQIQVWIGTLHAAPHTCNISKFGLEHCMQLHTLATNPSLDWNTACSCTHLQQIQVWIGTWHAAAHACNKSKFGLEHCMQLHTLATNPSLDWGIFNHADLHYRTAKIRKGRKEGCLQPGGH